MECPKSFFHVSLDAHAQRGLRYLVCVRLSVLCLFPRLRATRQQNSDTNGFIGFVLKGDFRISTYSVPSISGTARVSQDNCFEDIMDNKIMII